MMQRDNIASVIAGIAEAGAKPKRGKAEIPAAKSAGPSIGSAKGTGYGTTPAAAGGSSISSFTVETISGSSSLQLVSSDGFFVISLPAIVDMVDNAGQAVEINFPS